MLAVVMGCGYVGSKVAELLTAAGHEVVGVARGPLNPAASWRGISADITQPESLRTLPDSPDWIVNTVSSSRGGAEAYEKVFFNGTRHLLAHYQENPPRKYVHLSSTSVYAQTDDAWVNEQCAAEPVTETGRWLRRTEETILGNKEWPGIVLRVAGIYGPERGVLYQQFLRNEARIHGDGARYLNMVHRDDVARAVLFCLEHVQPPQILNVCDDEPVTEREFFSWLASTLQRPLPPSASEEELLKRKRGFSSKRISNQLLKKQGFAFTYPHFRDGFKKTFGL